LSIIKDLPSGKTIQDYSTKIIRTFMLYSWKLVLKYFPDSKRLYELLSKNWILGLNLHFKTFILSLTFSFIKINWVDKSGQEILKSYFQKIKPYWVYFIFQVFLSKTLMYTKICQSHIISQKICSNKWQLSFAVTKTILKTVWIEIKFLVLWWLLFLGLQLYSTIIFIFI